MAGLRLAIFLFFALVAALPLKAEELVRSMHADIEVARTGTMMVTETIAIVSTGERFKHGIYRDIPLGFVNPEGMGPVALDIVKVERDGKPEKHMRTPIDLEARIYVGEKGVLLPPGDHVYRLTYKMENMVRPAGAEEMFGWAVTGRWDFRIESASATVRLPDGVKILATMQHAGMPDTTDDNVRVEPGNGTLTFSTRHGLAPGEELSFKILIPRNTIERPPLKN